MTMEQSRQVTTLEVTMRCGCTGKVRTSEEIKYADPMVCDTHGATSAVRVVDIYATKPVLEGVQPRPRGRHAKMLDDPTPPLDESGIPKALIAACDGDKHMAGRVYGVVQEFGRKNTRLDREQKQLTVRLEATETVLNKTIGRLAVELGVDGRRLLDEVYKERETIRIEILRGERERLSAATS